MSFFKRRAFFVLIVIIAATSAIMHSRVFELDLMGVHVWRQTQTQSTVLNYAQEDFNILNSRINNRGSGDGIFRMEFAVMQWMFAGVYKMLDTDDPSVSRILTFIIGLISVWGMYVLIRNLSGNKWMGMIGAWCFNFSPVFYYYTVNPLPDNFSLATGIWGLAWFFKWQQEQRTSQVFLSAFMLLLATLSKLPFIVYGIVPALYFITDIIRTRKFRRENLVMAGIFILLFIPAAAWYITVVPTWENNGVVAGIFAGTPWEQVKNLLCFDLTYQFPEVLLNIAALPFFLIGFILIPFKRVRSHPAFPYLLACSFAVMLYLLYELNMIGTDHDYYLFPFLPLIFIITAYGAWHLFRKKRVYLMMPALLIMLALPYFAFEKMDMRWNEDKPDFNIAYLEYRDELRAATPDDALVIVRDGTPYICLYYLNKKGWSNNGLPGWYDPGVLYQMANEGAKYFYCDKREIDEDPAVKPLLEELIMTRNDVRVWKLKQPAPAYPPPAPEQ
jgi:hypothetical protein